MALSKEEKNARARARYAEKKAYASSKKLDQETVRLLRSSYEARVRRRPKSSMRKAAKYEEAGGFGAMHYGGKRKPRTVAGEKGVGRSAGRKYSMVKRVEGILGSKPRKAAAPKSLVAKKKAAPPMVQKAANRVTGGKKAALTRERKKIQSGIVMPF